MAFIPLALSSLCINKVGAPPLRLRHSKFYYLVDCTLANLVPDGLQKPVTWIIPKSDKYLQENWESTAPTEQSSGCNRHWCCWLLLGSHQPTQSRGWLEKQMDVLDRLVRTLNTACGKCPCPWEIPMSWGRGHFEVQFKSYSNWALNAAPATNPDLGQVPL